MCSAPGRKSSFRIEDILKTSKGSNNQKTTPQERKHEVELCNKAIITGKQCENVEKQMKQNYHDSVILRRNLTAGAIKTCESRMSLDDDRLSGVPTDLSHYRGGLRLRSADDIQGGKIIGHSSRFSAFSSIEKYGYSRPIGSYPVNYGQRFTFPPSPPYLESSYGAAFANAASLPSQWPQSPTLMSGYGLPAHHTNSYPHLAYAHFCRPMHSMPLAFTKRKGGQVRFTPQQTQNLERRFNSHKYLSPEDRRVLAGQLKLSDRQVKTWFQNRRAKWRRANNLPSTEGEDQDSDILSDDEISPSASDGGAFYASPTQSPISVG